MTIKHEKHSSKANNTLSGMALETFGDVSAMEDRLQWNIRSVP